MSVWYCWELDKLITYWLRWEGGSELKLVVHGVGGRKYTYEYIGEL